jgi:hypothetical protein
LTRDFRERRAVLEPLVATNAPMSAVRERVGDFWLWRQRTPDWTNVFSKYVHGSKWDQYIAGKMQGAATTGHTSTIDLQTWMFFDERDRLVGFEIGTQ